VASPPDIVDSHHHLWDPSAPYHAWLHGEQPWASEEELARLRRSFTVADLEPEARAAGVTSTVVVQTASAPGETPGLLSLAVAHDLIGAVVGWVDLTSPGAGDALAALGELPGGGYLAGIRHPVLAEADEQWLARPGVLRGLAAVADAGLVYDIVCLPSHLPAAVTAATALPSLTFVLDHLGNPDADPDGDGPWAQAIRELGALPNTVCKLSGVLSCAFPAGVAAPDRSAAGIDPLIKRYYEVCVQAFGPDRLMFGSDWPPCTLSSAYRDVVSAAGLLTAGLSQAEQEAVFAATARRTYGLPRQAGQAGQATGK
jgi:L-fuconolactonase